MGLDTAAVVVREAIRELGRAGLSPGEFLYEVGGRIGRVVPHDAAGWMTLDPDSLLPTGSLEIGKTGQLVRELWRANHEEPDANQLSSLVARPSPITVTSQLGPEITTVSPRVRLLQSAGLGDNLRAVLRAGSHTWGLVALYRESTGRIFDEREREFMSTVAPEIGEGLRRSLSQQPDPEADALAPGVVIFNADGAIVSATEEANRIARLVVGEAELSLYALAVKATSDDGARARIRLSDGRWVQIQGSRLRGIGEDTNGLVVRMWPASSLDLTSMLLRLHGLTARERQVAEQLLTGRSTDAIAEHLHISRHTLRDHVKAVFAKVGVSSRSQLVARITGYSPPLSLSLPEASPVGSSR